MTDINEMKRREAALSEQIKKMSLERRDLQQQIAEISTPLKVGDRVAIEGDERVWELSKIAPGYGTEPHFHGRLIKKNGQPGSLVRQIFVPWKKLLRKVAAAPVEDQANAHQQMK